MLESWQERVFRVLDSPFLYRLSQSVLAPGGKKRIVRQLQTVLAEVPPTESVLDVGCGPSSWLWNVGLEPFGVDICPRYVEAYLEHGGTAMVGSADRLPFPDDSFDGVWCMGLLHHLDHTQASACIAEMLRVRRLGGYVVLFDAVLPHSAWWRPVAWAVRKLDRGRFMRTEQQFRGLLPLGSPSKWTIRRITYSLNGLEALICVHLG